MTIFKLKFQMFSYWHCGSGRGSGSTVDALVHKDHAQLPEIPGRTVKGLLRDAFLRAESWGHFPAGTTEYWFGTDSRKVAMEQDAQPHDDQANKLDRFQTVPGFLIFDNAVIDETLASWLRHPNQADACQELYRHLYSTAINPETGAAQDKSLRGMEVVIPLELCAPISFRPGSEEATDINQLVDQTRLVLPLIRGLGLARNRGLGRCQVTLTEVCA